MEPKFAIPKSKFEAKIAVGATDTVVVAMCDAQGRVAAKRY